MTHFPTALIGVKLAMLQNVVYCTPPRSCNAFVSPTNAVIEASIDNSTWIAQTVTEGYFTTVGPFIRCTDLAGCEVIFKAL